MSMVHVFLTSEIFYPDLPGGALLLHNYGPGLTKRDIRLHMHTPRKNDDHPEQETVNGVTIHRLSDLNHLPVARQRLALLDAALGQALRARKQGHRCVIQPSHVSHRMLLRWLRARASGIATIKMLDICPERPNAHGLVRRARQWAVDILTFCAITHYIAISREMRRIYLAEISGITPDRISVISNGVDMERFHPCANPSQRLALRERLGIGAHHRVALFVGGVMPRKGVDILLRAWDAVTARHPDALLLIVGSNTMRPSHDVPGLREPLLAYLERVRTLHSQLQKPESVRFIGPYKDWEHYYQIADVFTLPSYLEGLPNVMLEAMACGLPCVTANFKGTPQSGEEFGHLGQHFFKIGHEPVEWSETLCHLLQDDFAAKREAMGAASRQWIAETNALPDVIDQWAAFYQSIAQR